MPVRECRKNNPQPDGPHSGADVRAFLKPQQPILQCWEENRSVLENGGRQEGLEKRVLERVCFEKRLERQSSWPPVALIRANRTLSLVPP